MTLDRAVRFIARAVAGLAIAFASADALAQKPWLALTQGDITVWTNVDEKTARAFATRVFQFRRAADATVPGLKWGTKPLVVFVSKDEAVLRNFAPQFWEGGPKPSSFHAELSKTRLLGLRSGLDGDDKKRSPDYDAFRNWSAAAIAASLGRDTPEWLGRGLAATLGDTVVREKDFTTRRLPLSTVEEAREAASKVPDLFARTGEFTSTDSKRDAVAQALLHSLMADAAQSKKLTALIASLTRGTAPAAAMKTSGLDPATFQGSLQWYLQSKNFRSEKKPLPAVRTAASATLRTPSALDIALLEMEQLFEMDRPLEARQRIREAKKLDDKNPRPWEIEGLLFEAEQRATDARSSFEGAVLRGTKNAAIPYRLAQMSWKPELAPAELAEIETWLRKARELNPADASTQAYLAEILTDQNKAKEAIPLATRATQLSRTPYTRLALARAQWNARKPAEAIATARAALQSAPAGSGDRSRIDAFLKFAQANRTAQTRGTKAYTIPQAPPAGPLGGSAAHGATASSGPSSTLGSSGARAASSDGASITACFARRDNAACARAIPSLETACADNSGEACTSLGSIYEGGLGVPRDPRRAITLYRSGCAAAHPPGCARQATLEAQGAPGSRAVTRAFATLERLCGENVADACLGWGQLLANRTTKADRDRGATLIRKACDLGHGEACSLSRR